MLSRFLIRWFNILFFLLPLTFFTICQVFKPRGLKICLSNTRFCCCRRRARLYDAIYDVNDMFNLCVLYLNPENFM